MRRYALDQIVTWAASPERRPLVLRGARQTGKTWLVEHLAQHGQPVIGLNFERNPDLAACFSSNDPTAILAVLEARLRRSIATDTDVLFLDEVQAAPMVLGKLRWFAEELPQLRVIAAGSLLDFALLRPEFSMPVGRLTFGHLEPMTFAEFLLALAEDRLLAAIQGVTPDSPLAPPLHDRALQLVREYMIVGGMPAALRTWVDTRSFAAVAELHRDLLQTMRDDFAKYGDAAALLRIEKVFAALPRLVGRKFQPVQVDRDERSLGLKDAFRMLAMARVATAVQRTAANGLPLGAEVDVRYQKVCVLDVGLLTTQVGLRAEELVTGPQRRIDEGPTAEQFVGQELRACRPFNQEPALFTWVREARNSNAEVDYVLQVGARIVPIEVKAGAAGRLRSLHMMVHEKDLDLAVRIGSGPIQLKQATTALPTLPPRTFWLLSVPFYLVGEIDRLVREL